jgi:3'-phosphoadenosine 5'-phosphosulfate sulfotransferase (PAPS reductase)/FAD synthetase
MAENALGKASNRTQSSDKSFSGQTAFTTKEYRTKEVLRRCSSQCDPETVLVAVSGGTDSIVAADVMARFGPEYGLAPTHMVHIDTGTGIPQTELTARTLAEMHDLEFIKQGYRNPQDSLAGRILENGWPGGYAGSPATGGHGLEWANRKDKPMNAVYMQFEGDQLWVSGARKLESKQRQGNVPDSGIESDKPRRTWISPIGGWTEEEKRDYIQTHNLPVSEAYLLLGFSGECTACAYDSPALLTGLNLLCPERAYALKSLAVWLYQRVKRGDVDLAPKRLCWGWDVEDTPTNSSDPPTAQELVGCDPESCGGDADTEWIKNLSATQLITRQDVLEWWASQEVPQRFTDTD